MAFTREFIEELKNRNSIDEVVGRIVTLKRAGANLSGLCPFHSEKTPSFTVFPSTSSYYCFGCGAGGDVVTFVMQTENVDYREAVEILAKRAGIPVEEEKTDFRDATPVVKKDRLLAINKEAGRFFYSALVSPQGEGARAYLAQRRFSSATVKRFGIGYAPAGGAPLYNHLLSKGFTPLEMKTAFLCGESRNGRMYDVFRNRLMFPIFDANGDVVAFSGRRLNEEDERKYINTSDTPLFKKSRVLFGLNIAKRTETGYLILCEGAPDAIAMHQAGFDNAIATLGTAITTEHARVIARICRTVYLAYDIDKAGKKATLKGIELLNQVGVDTKIINLGTEAKDPDEYIKKFGADSFRAKLTGSSGQIDYSIDEIISRFDITVAEEQLRAARELTEYIAKLSTRPEREVYAVRAAQKLGMSRDSLREEVERAATKMERTAKKDRVQKILREQNGMGDSVNRDKIRYSSEAAHEEAVIGIMLVRADLGPLGCKKLNAESFSTELNKRFFEFLKEDLMAGREPLLSRDGLLTPREQGCLESYRASRLSIGDNNETSLQSHIDALLSLKERREYEKKIELNPADALSEYLGKLKEKRNGTKPEV